MKTITADRRIFYIASGGVMTLIALVGFWPSYFGPLLRFDAARSAVIHFHAAVYVGWLALFMIQVVYAATGKVRQHRKLGQIGIAYGVLVILVGLGTTLFQYAGQIEENGLEASLEYPTWPLIDMAIFAPFFGLAVAWRHRPEVHKRLMIVATTTLLIAAAGRMPLEFNLVRVVWFSPILLGLAYDLLKRHAVHPVYVIGLVVLFVSSFRDGLMATDSWPALMRWLGTLIS